MFKKILRLIGIAFAGLFVTAIIVAVINPEPPVGTTELASNEQPQLEQSTTSEQVEVDVAKADAATPAPTKPVSAAVPAPKPQTQPAPTPTSGYTYYSVTKVVDGDTIAINLNGTTETIRLIGINTPETVDPRKPVECFGTEASNQAKSLLTGKRVRIEKDPTQGERDKYGRLLTYVWREDGLFFNQNMIQQGYAYEYTYNTPYKYQAQFKADQAAAKAAGKGLWAPGVCDSSTTTTPPSATTQTSSHTFYLSTHYSAKFYYCDSDEGWKSLSPSYLKQYPSEQALLAAYPSRTLHEACE